MNLYCTLCVLYIPEPEIRYSKGRKKTILHNETKENTLRYFYVMCLHASVFLVRIIGCYVIMENDLLGTNMNARINGTLKGLKG